jgi:uncharacterized transporter YbjL
MDRHSPGPEGGVVNIAAFLLAMAAILALAWDLYRVRVPGLGPAGRVALILFVAAFSAQLIWHTPHQVSIH